MAPFATLYTPSAFRHPRVLKIQAAANINGLDIEIPPSFDFGTSNKTPEYIAKFPLGKIPALETASGFNLTEASAIAYFVSDSGPKREQLLGSSVTDRALVQQWIFFSDSQLQPTLTPLIIPHTGRGPYDAKVEEAHTPDLKRWLTYIEGQLKGRVWLVNDSEGPSLADLSLGGIFVFGFQYYIDAEMRDEYPNLMNWYNRLVQVPEVKDGFGDVVLLDKRPTLTAG